MGLTYSIPRFTATSVQYFEKCPNSLSHTAFKIEILSDCIPLLNLKLLTKSSDEDQPFHFCFSGKFLGSHGHDDEAVIAPAYGLKKSGIDRRGHPDRHFLGVDMFERIDDELGVEGDLKLRPRIFQR